jgi:hypothetical protein
MARFEVVEETDETPVLPAERNDPIPAAALDTILLGLKTLPKRTALALSNCFALLTVASVFCLSLMIIPFAPTSYQLGGLSGYALFIIVINMITRRS